MWLLRRDSMLMILSQIGYRAPRLVGSPDQLQPYVLELYLKIEKSIGYFIQI